MKNKLSKKILRIALRITANGQRLAVYDFDDTLVSSVSTMSVIKENGEKIDMDSATFAYFKPSVGDTLDFTGMNNITNPRIIKKNFEKFKQDALDGNTKTVILTARAYGASTSVKKFLDYEKIKNVDVIALQSSNPMDKANSIDRLVRENGINEVEFTDDSASNVKAVESIRRPGLNLTTNNPVRPSKDEDFEGNSIEQIFISDNPTKAVFKIEKPKVDNSVQENKRDNLSNDKFKKDEEWWREQSKDFQREYLKQHPNSHYANIKKGNTMNDTDRIKQVLSEGAKKAKSEKIRRYVLDILVKKVEQAGVHAPIFIEQLTRDFLKARPQGYFSSFTKEDFLELQEILRMV